MPPCPIETDEDEIEYVCFPKLDFTSDARLRISHLGKSEIEIRQILMKYGRGSEARRLREDDMRLAFANPNHEITLPVWTPEIERTLLMAKINRHHELEGNRRAKDTAPSAARTATNEGTNMIFKP